MEPLTPSLAAVGRAALGFVALGATAALGADWSSAAHTAPSALIVHLGAFALTGPTLLVAHPFLGLEAKPDVLVAGLGRAFVRAGDLALGLSPLLLFFAATTAIAHGLFVVLLAFVGGAGLLGAARDLVAAEALTPGASPAAVHKMRVLAAAWSALTVLGAARVGWEVLS